MNAIEKAKYIIDKISIMTIATADKSGKPHISPVSFMYDDSYNLFWVSSKNATHSKNIKSRPQVYIVILGELPYGETDGVYFDAEAAELTGEEEINAAIKLLDKRHQPTKFRTKTFANVTGDAEWRIYKAAPIKISKRADAFMNGQAVTVRTDIQLV